MNKKIKLIVVFCVLLASGIAAVVIYKKSETGNQVPKISTGILHSSDGQRYDQ